MRSFVRQKRWLILAVVQCVGVESGDAPVSHLLDERLNPVLHVAAIFSLTQNNDNYCLLAAIIQFYPMMLHVW